MYWLIFFSVISAMIKKTLLLLNYKLLQKFTQKFQNLPPKLNEVDHLSLWDCPFSVHFTKKKQSLKNSSPPYIKQKWTQLKKLYYHYFPLCDMKKEKFCAEKKGLKNRKTLWNLFTQPFLASVEILIAKVNCCYIAEINV